MRYMTPPEPGRYQQFNPVTQQLFGSVAKNSPRLIADPYNTSVLVDNNDGVRSESE
jgi:hypothetical protein